MKDRRWAINQVLLAIEDTTTRDTWFAEAVEILDALGVTEAEVRDVYAQRCHEEV